MRACEQACPLALAKPWILLCRVTSRQRHARPGQNETSPNAQIWEPLCRVTPGSGAPVEAPTPSAAWELLYRREGEAAAAQRGGGGGGGSATQASDAVHSSRLSGARQFGLAVPRVLALLRGLPHAPRCARFAAWPRARPAAEPLVRCPADPRMGVRAPRRARFAAWPRARPAAEPLVSIGW